VRPVLGLVLLLAGLAGCAGPSPSPTGSGAPTPSIVPPTSTVEIDHLPGPTDVVFRFEEGGGFVPIDFFATQAPQFTLYGDGTVLFRDRATPAPPQPNPNVAALPPYRIGHLSEPAMQAFLRFALADSGLGVARVSYSPGNVADAPTSIFTIHAGGVDKVVSVEALGLGDAQGPDAPILRALAGLADRVRSFGSSVGGAVTWSPERWRGILTANPANAPMAWPWRDIGPADFVPPAGQDGRPFPIRILTPADVAALGLSGIDGGLMGLGLTGPDGTTYTLALRPLLPDEAS
jgi:hypothetical protein